LNSHSIYKNQFLTWRTLWANDAQSAAKNFSIFLAQVEMQEKLDPEFPKGFESVFADQLKSGFSEADVCFLGAWRTTAGKPCFDEHFLNYLQRIRQVNFR
jgi:hypothetical protein